MTKQEKIDWGIRKFLGDAFNCEDDNYLYEVSLALRQYLQKSGVVIKVKRKLPEGFIGVSYLGKKDRMLKRYWVDEEKLKEAGYEAVVPLIGPQ